MFTNRTNKVQRSSENTIFSKNYEKKSPIMYFAHAANRKK